MTISKDLSCMPFIAKYVIWFFPIISLVLLIIIAAMNWQVFKNPDAVMYTYLHNVVHGRAGYGLQEAEGNNISFADLEPGDIILGGYPGCSYGRFTHVALYIGDGMVIEGFAELGICTQSVTHFWDYSDVCLLRVKADEDIKVGASNYVKDYDSRLFYPIAFKPGERIWNCSKIIWKAYMMQGLNLDPDNDLWIAPDVFYESSKVEIIREMGRLSEDN